MHNTENQKAPDTAPVATFGQALVGYKFNPSGDDKVAKLKSLFAEAADIINYHNELMKAQNKTTQDTQRIFSHALMEILNGQMNAVKFVTLQY